ncbi:MAG TPA: hypothetical protein DGH68_02945 [Bacteroidetes bacterium]|nr:hypothetical protein [Bacteroidota bacterium]
MFDNDQGKNTGGMGAYAPAPVITPAILEQVKRTIIEPTLSGMRAEGRPYKGCLYVGLIVTGEGPRVIEYNARFGDPETQVVLPLYEGDLFELLDAACEGSISSQARVASGTRGSAVCVVLASGGYPDKYETGKVIGGLDDLAGVKGIVAFHAGTIRDKGAVVTSGGRVLGITSISDSPDLGRTIMAAYEGVRMVNFRGMHYRHDIGRKGLTGRVVSWHD